MAQSSATVNTRQPGNLPSSTIQNPKNDGHCMTITTRGGKQTIDPPMPSNEEKVLKYNDKVVEVSGEVEHNTEIVVEVPKTVTPMSRPPPPFSQRLVKKIEDAKYWRFITMLRSFLSMSLW